MTDTTDSKRELSVTVTSPRIPKAKFNQTTSYLTSFNSNRLASTGINSNRFANSYMGPASQQTSNFSSPL